MLFLCLGGLLPSCGGPGNPETTSESEENSTNLMSDWPLFRGDPELQGVSSEMLSAPLDLAWTYESAAGEAKRRAPIEASAVVKDGIV